MMNMKDDPELVLHTAREKATTSDQIKKKRKQKKSKKLFRTSFEREKNLMMITMKDMMSEREREKVREKSNRN